MNVSAGGFNPMLLRILSVIIPGILAVLSFIGGNILLGVCAVIFILILLYIIQKAKLSVVSFMQLLIMNSFLISVPAVAVIAAWWLVVIFCVLNLIFLLFYARSADDEKPLLTTAIFVSVILAAICIISGPWELAIFEILMAALIVFRALSKKYLRF